MKFTEAETQVMVTLHELRTAGKPADAEGLDSVKVHFRKYLEDWTPAFESLIAKDLVKRDGEVYELTDLGRAFARQLHRDRPPSRMWYWYKEYYEKAPVSRAHAEFCERLFGRDFCQHGFSDMAQIEKMLELGAFKPTDHLLELGCGTGSVAEFISDKTGARVTGIDIVPEAIRIARERTADKQDRLTFREGNVSHIHFPTNSFDGIISIDSLYFAENLSDTLRQMTQVVRPGGQMLIFYNDVLAGDPPGQWEALEGVLKEHALPFSRHDFTREHLEHAKRKLEIAEELRPAFEAEGNLFLYENRAGEARGEIAAVEAGTGRRSLYHVRVP